MNVHCDITNGNTIRMTNQLKINGRDMSDKSSEGKLVRM